MKWNENAVRIGGIMALMASLGTAQTMDGGIYVAGPNNALTSAEAQCGYQLLWNGKDFTGWKTFNAAAPGTNFGIVGLQGAENGAKKSVNPDSNMIEVMGGGESMWTKDTTYQDFDWLIEFRTTPGRSQNGGLLYRYSESENKENNASAFEYQVCNSAFIKEWNVPDVTAGAIYELKPLQNSRLNLDKSPNWMRTDGKWNQARIICYKGRIAHYGNGLKLAEDLMGTADWKDRYQHSKFNKYPYFATIHPGSVFLQDHGEVYVKYRNIRIKKLTQNPWGPDSPYLDRAAASKGDTSLIDTLTFAMPLFPVTRIGANPYFGAAPEVRVLARQGGTSVLVGKAAGYEARLHDLRGAALTLRAERTPDGWFMPTGSVPAGAVLSVWKDGNRVQDVVLGNR